MIWREKQGTETILLADLFPSQSTVFIYSSLPLVIMVRVAVDLEHTSGNEVVSPAQVHLGVNRLVTDTLTSIFLF